MVEYSDGSTLAQLGPPDMRAPIACAFAWPDRLPWPAPRLDLAAMGQLTFEAPDLQRFPAIALARAALDAGGGAPAAMNAANEIAVAAFLDRKIGFLDIAPLVSDTLDRMNGVGDLDAGVGDGALEGAIDHGRVRARNREVRALQSLFAERVKCVAHGALPSSGFVIFLNVCCVAGHARLLPRGIRRMSMQRPALWAGRFLNLIGRLPTLPLTWREEYHRG